MQTHVVRRTLRALVISAVAAWLVDCSGVDDPYAKLAEPPLVQAHLHTVTLVSADASLAAELPKDGYRLLPFPPNYPRADEVLGMLWGVPSAVAKSATVYHAPSAGPNLRLVIGPLPAAAPHADARIERSFFRNVLGADVPRWPGNVARTDAVRVLVWTYQVPDILDARKKLRANAIPLVTDPVGITTPYLGDQKSMSLRAPDGTMIELVETAAQ